MILIHRFKKIKPNKAIKEIIWDISFFISFFILGVCFVFSKVPNREEGVMIIQNSTSTSIENTISIKNDKNNGKFVASSRGKYFYPAGSTKANSLSEKNKVYFDTEEEAKKQGFKPYITN